MFLRRSLASQRGRSKRGVRGRAAPPGVDEGELLDAIRNNLNANDHALYNLLGCFPLLRWLAGIAGQELRGRDVLEIGTSKLPGLPLVLLLHGCRRVTATNQIAVDGYLSEPYAHIVQLVMGALLSVDPHRLDEVLRWETRGGERVGALREDAFVNLSPVPIEELDLPAASADLAFSFSVLEHVERPREALDAVFRALRPGGWTLHSIDLRDHTDFTRPLEFLRWGEEEHLRRTSCPQNRLRASDFVALFETAGFEDLRLRIMDEPPALTPGGGTDLVAMLARPLDALLARASLDEVEPWVSEEMRLGFDARFREKSLRDLSALVLCVAARRPG